MNRVSFILDGFNLYHSIRQAEEDTGASARWLDIRSLCEDYVYLFGRDAVFERAFYFSALAHHLEATSPDVTQRHRAYIECLKSSGVEVVLNRFKRKSVRCPTCGQRHNRYEEKETDVALAVKLLEMLALDECDTVVLVTGDTDLAPPVRAAERLYPQKRVLFAFPYRRKNKELKHLAPASFEIGKGQYAKYQFPDPVVLASGRAVAKPETW